MLLTASEEEMNQLQTRN